MNSTRHAGWMVSLVALALAACGSSQDDESKAKNEPFEAGELATVENEELGFSIRKPVEVDMTVAGDTATLAADGFPTITVTLEETEDIGTGTSTSRSMGTYELTLDAPRRRLVCACADVGANEELVDTICKSLAHTEKATTNPTVRAGAPEIEGETKNDVAAALGELEPEIAACWTKAVADHPTLMTGGTINFLYGYGADGAVVRSNPSWSGFYQEGPDGQMETSSGPAADALRDCVAELLATVKPEPEGEELALGWQLEFELY